MKFQDSTFNGLKVTVGTKSVTHAPTHARTLQKQYAPSTCIKIKKPYLTSLILTDNISS